LLFKAMGRALGGQSYDYRNRLSAFTREIHTVFSLKEQGGELLELVTKALGCKKACLLFLDDTGRDFHVQLCEPPAEQERLSSLILRENNPILEHLRKEGKPLTRDEVAILPEFRSLWQQEKDEIRASDIELFMPLISRGRMIGILGLDRKQYGRYTLEDFNLLEEVTSRVAVSMEKEYLRELLREREEELSIINRSSAIITSSLEIQRIYGSFIKELKRAVNVNWAAIVLLEDAEIYFLALSSEIGSAWQVGERIPAKNTAVEYIATSKTAVIEPDLSQGSDFAMRRYFLEQGIRSVVYLPLIVNKEVIGSLVVASRRPNAYSNKEVKLLEELASLIAMPIENSRLYARAEQMARSDALTGLLNRRSMDELVASEVNRHSRYGGIFSIIILDLDSLKAYNDNYGHPAGDEILKKVGTILKTSIRNIDQAFRYGGDEFALLLPQTDGSDACKIAERVRNRIAMVSGKNVIPVTASLGIACWPTDGIGAPEVIAAADSALLQAKRNGGNRSQLYAQNNTQDSASGVKVISEDSRVLSTIYNLAATVDARGNNALSHSKKVNEYAVALAEALNLEPLEISRLSTCAFLHDIGKIGISDEILNKPSKLSPEEWRIVKEHTNMGAAIASHARQLQTCIKGILYHHERYDGKGYPEGLKGDEIPMEARILAIADAFAAMMSERSYSSTLTREQALQELKRCAGRQFDPNLVKVFLRVMEAEPVAAAKEKKSR
jgi:diguanylate cyclase (GGDEF)-like protein/putative nucleotidyltransferase with HDIG domain